MTTHDPSEHSSNRPPVLVPVRAGYVRKIVLGAVSLVLFVILFYAEENLRGKWAWTRFRHQWEQKGETFDYRKVAPPPVSDDENFAMAPVVLSSYSGTMDQKGRTIPGHTQVVNRLIMPVTQAGPGLVSEPAPGNWQKSERTDLAAWQKYYRDLANQTNVFPVPSQAHAPASDVLFALSKYDPTIEELREAARRPASRFPLEYDADDPASILLPHLAPMKGVTRLLQFRADAELALGQTDAALADVQLACRLIDSLQSEPLLISHLVRIAMLSNALEPVWEGLADHRWSDAQLVQIDQVLQRLDFLADYRLAMRGEECFSAGTIDYLRRTRDPSLLFMSGPGEENPPGGFQTILFRAVPSGWFYQNQLNCGRMMVEYFVPMADMERRIISPGSVQKAEAALEADVRHKGPYNMLEGMLMPALGNAVKKFAYAQTAVDLARVACALERYRLAHGRYPAALDELSPRFLEKLPHDVINGEPLRYRLTGDRYVLYSVGWNETDDEGQVGLKPGGALDNSSGDWVWRNF